MEDPVWPPQSSHDALLSSPSMRRRYRRLQETRPPSSVSPLERHSHSIDDEGEEDEETLKLRLEAIEARLKLKKIQNQRAEARATNSPSQRPSVTSSATKGNSRTATDHIPCEPDSTVRVDVPISPMKRHIQPPELPRSPGRVLLGIDKGRSGKDVSLRSPSRNSVSYTPEDLRKSSISVRCAKTPAALQGDQCDYRVGKTESFNERMAIKRQYEIDALQERERSKKLRQNRTKGFGIHPEEMNSYKEQAMKLVKDDHTADERSKDFSREQILIATKAPTNFKGLHRQDSNGEKRRLLGEQISNSQVANEYFESSVQNTDVRRQNSDHLEKFSATLLSKRLIPQEALVTILKDKKIIDITTMLRNVKEPDWRIPEHILADHENFVVFGIIGQKSQPLDHKEKSKVSKENSISTKASHTEAEETWLNDQKKYMVITLVTPDLRWSVDMYLFTTAYSRWRLVSQGTLVAILNPGIMPPPPGKTNTNKWSLKLNSSEDTILEIGSSRDIGWCKALRRNGEACGQWIDGRRLQYCEWHLSQGIAKAKSARMETQGSGFANKRSNESKYSRRSNSSNRSQKGENSQGCKFDMFSQSQYFLNPAGSNGRSTARLIDFDNVARDCGLSNEERRRRFAEREREKQMAIQLGANGSGAGAEYMKLRNVLARGESSSSLAQHVAPKTRDDSEKLKLSRRKKAEVRLSPLKRKASEKGAAAGKKVFFPESGGTREVDKQNVSIVQEIAIDEGDDLEIV